MQGAGMLNSWENMAVIIVCVTLSCTFLVSLNRFWSPEKRRVHNDVIGWQITVIGTIYAVMIGFMLYAVWGNYQAADANVSGEANSAVNLFRIAAGLPAEQRDAIQKLSEDYANAMVTDEWPAMDKGKFGLSSREIIRGLWTVTTGTVATTNSQQTSLDHALYALTELTQHRRLRELQSHSTLPAILWAVLICGGVITIVACCLIGSENARLHFALIVALSLMISLTLTAIGDIDGPFRGSVHVSSYDFVQAQQTMAEWRK